MLRTKKKQLNLKPNRALDKRSSRGMLFENEELRLRTINIADEVERGQNDVKKLRKENEYLKREIWNLRDECEKLEDVVHKIYSGQAPDISELPTYQPTRKHSIHSTSSTAFGSWSMSRRMSCVSNYSSFGGEYEEEDAEGEGEEPSQDRDRDNNKRVPEEDEETDGPQQQQQQPLQNPQQLHPYSYTSYGEEGKQNLHVHLNNPDHVDGDDEYEYDYNYEDHVHQQEDFENDGEQIKVHHQTSFDQNPINSSCDLDPDPDTDPDRIRKEGNNDSSQIEEEDSILIRHHNNPPLHLHHHHHPWHHQQQQQHSFELEAVKEESESNNGHCGHNKSFSQVELNDQEIHPFNSSFFNPKIEITPASASSTSSTTPSTNTNPNPTPTNNVRVEPELADKDDAIVKVNKRMSPVNEDVNNNDSNKDISGSQLLLQDLGCVTLVPKKYQVTSEIKINVDDPQGFQPPFLEEETSTFLHLDASPPSLKPPCNKTPSNFPPGDLDRSNSNSRSNNTISSRGSLEEKRRSFGHYRKNGSSSQQVKQGHGPVKELKEKDISTSDSESQSWINTNSNSHSHPVTRKKSLPLYQSEPSLASIDRPCQKSGGGLRTASESSCSCIMASPQQQYPIVDCGFDGFDHTVEMCGRNGYGGAAEAGVYRQHDHELDCLPLDGGGDKDENEEYARNRHHSVSTGWNSVDRNVVIGFLDEVEGEEGGFADLTAQEVIDELESQFDQSLEQVAGVRMLIFGLGSGNSSDCAIHGPKRVFISFRTAAGVKTFIDKGFCIRNRPLRLTDASKKFSLILLIGIPPAVPDSAAISMLNELGQVVAPLERRVYKGVDISERIARMHLVRDIPSTGTPLSIAGYPVLTKVLQSNVSPATGVLSSNSFSLSRPHSQSSNHHQLIVKPPETNAETVRNNSLLPPCETHSCSQPTIRRYHLPVVQHRRHQSQIPVPNPDFVPDSPRSSILVENAPAARCNSPTPNQTPNIPAIPNTNTSSRIPAPAGIVHRKLGKSISAAPGYLPGNPGNSGDPTREASNPPTIHPPPSTTASTSTSNLGPTALAIIKRNKLPICSVDPPPTSTPTAEPTLTRQSSTSANPNPKKPLSRLPGSSGPLIPQIGEIPQILDSGTPQQQQPTSPSRGGGLGKSLLRSLSYQPRRTTRNSVYRAHNNVSSNNNINNNNNISQNHKGHGSQTSLAELSMHPGRKLGENGENRESFHGHGIHGHGSIRGSTRAPKSYQPHGQLTNTKSNSSQLRNGGDKKPGETSLPWFGCC